MSTVAELPLIEIVRGDNDRTFFDPEALRDLSESIKEIGLKQPITVRPFTDPDNPVVMYQIVAGERRFRAVTMLGADTIEAIIKDENDMDASLTMLSENLVRKDLKPLEEGRAFEKRMNLFGWDRFELARRLGVHEGTIRNRLVLLKLIPEAQKMLEEGDLPSTHAVYMGEKLDAERQLMALKAFKAKRIPPMNQFRALCNELKAASQERDLFDTTELFLERQEASEVKTNGGAGVKTCPDVPLPVLSATVGGALEEVMAKLIDAGREEDALLIGTVYDYMVRQKLCTVPVIRQLPAELLLAAE